MKKFSLTQNHQTEKAIIDALLKISEIVQKIEASRQGQKSINTNKCSKKTVGDGDYNELYDDNQQQQVPLPPPMRTFDSYVSGFNQKSLQKPSNCNQASEKQCQDTNDYKDQEHSYKRHYYDISSTCSSSNDQHHRKKVSRHYSSHRSFRENKNPQSICQETEKIENQPTTTTFNSQTTSYQINSAATTILDDQSSSLIMTPITSAPTIPPPIIIEEQQQISSPSDILTNPKTDFDLFIDQQLQTTLEKCLKNHLSTKTINENIHQQQRKTRLSTLTKSETEKLIDGLDFTKQTSNLEHYEKQRELAILAAKQGNYSLSYSIYTNLLHDNQYDCKLKSEILASRATILLLEEKCFESINDCTQAVAFNQWNKLAYVVRAACWMIKQEYRKAVEDYSRLFYFFDQSQYVLDLLNLAYEKFQLSNQNIDHNRSIKKENHNIIQQPLLSLASPAVYLCYPYQTYSTWYYEQQQPAKNKIFSEERFDNLHKTKHISSENTIRSTINPVLIKDSSTMNKKSQSNLIWIQNPYRSF